MALQDGIDLIKSTFTTTEIFGVGWIISIIIILLSLILITRDTQKWRIYAFPVSMGWFIVGLRSSLTIMLATGVLFVLEIVSLQQISQLLNIKKIPIIKEYTEKRQKERTDAEILKKEYQRESKRAIRSKLRGEYGDSIWEYADQVIKGKNK